MHRKSRIRPRMALVLLVAMLAVNPGLALTHKDLPAQGAMDKGTASLSPSETGLYIVRLAEPALASYQGGIAGLEATSPRSTGAAKLNPKALASMAYRTHLEARQDDVVGAIRHAVGRPVEPAFRYLSVLNGFALALSHEEAILVATLPGVQAVYPDVLRELDTDVGPVHIGAPEIWSGNTGTGSASRGEGIVIGVIDTGINSAHPSFAATDGDGYSHTNPFGAGVYKGWCAANPGFCNEKLIAAYTFHPNGGSPEDTNGHGSHTASTAGGNAHTASFSVGPTAYNIPIQGVAPRANIVAYKVCDPSCPTSSSIAAINSAILDDQVDVLNYSISGGDSPWTNVVDLAFLDAFNAGVFVSVSAGNAGPGSSTVEKTGPWNASVAASTINRVIAHTLDATGPTTPPELQGLTAAPGEGTAIAADINGPLRYDATNNTGCSPFPAGFFTGALALVQRGDCTFATKVDNAVVAGATGVVVFQNVGGPPIAMGSLTGTPPAVMIDLADGIALRDFVTANPTTATVRINTATSLVVNNAWQDIVAGFSGRGPSQFEILKPDYTAPGVNILAAVAAGGTPAQYGFMQGTSMSSPHGAGAAALLKALYPAWSPAEVKSALASTAAGGLTKEDGVTPADPFDVGSGLLALEGASKVGLVFDEAGANYLAADPSTGGDPKTLNQPSMADYLCSGTCTWTRTAKAVVNGTWNAGSFAPPGMAITVTPGTFTLNAGQTQVLTIEANVIGLPFNTWAFGGVTLTPTGGSVATTRLPVVVRTGAAPPPPPVPAPVGVCSNPNIPIPDFALGVPGQVSDTLTIPAGVTIADLNVYLRATHTWSGDLAFTLQHVPSGTTVTLVDRPGVPASTFGCSNDHYEVIVDDQGGDPAIEIQCFSPAPAIRGVAMGGDPPSNALLAAFNGFTSSGDWVLTAIDNAAGDTGTLVEWCLDITASMLPADVTATKTVSGNFTVGGAVTYTIVLTNAGPGDQGDNPGDEFTDTLPPSLTVTGASSSSGSAVAVGNTVSWNGSILAGGIGHGHHQRHHQRGCRGHRDHQPGRDLLRQHRGWSQRHHPPH